MADFHENCIEWVTGDDRIAVTLTQTKYISRIKSLAEKFPDEVDYQINKDGSLFGHVPLRYLKLNPPRKLSDEGKDALRESMRNLRETQR